MGTRGAMIFVAGDRRLNQYNQFDTYLSGLGHNIGCFLQDLVGGNLEQLAGLSEGRVAAARELVLALREVDEGDSATAEEREKYKHLAQRVSGGVDWYAVLRKLQGDPKAVLREGIIATNSKWGNNWGGGGCEYVYELDFNTQTLTVGAYGKKLGSFPFDTENLADKIIALGGEE